MKYIALIIFLSSCSVPRLSGPSADDLSGAPMVHDITLPIYEPTLIPSDDWFPDENYIDTVLASTDYKCDHVCLSAVIHPDNGKCCKCGAIICEEVYNNYYNESMPIRIINAPDSINLGCAHALQIRTMMYCDPPQPDCNTCTCAKCGYSYKCN